MPHTVPRFHGFANRMLRAVILPSVRVRVRVTGAERVPREGAIVVVSNHLSNLDPPVLGANFPRELVFMAKVEAFQGNPAMAWIYRNYGAFPVSRGTGDVGAIRTALSVLKGGGALFMAPEGTRSRTGTLGPPREGAALIAFRAGAPIVPIGLRGSGAFARNVRRWAPTEVTLTIGEPFRLHSEERRPSAATLTDMSHAIMERIAALLPPEQRGPYTEARHAALTREA